MLDVQGAETRAGTNLHLYRSQGTVAQRRGMNPVDLPAPADGLAELTVVCRSGHPRQ